MIISTRTKILAAITTVLSALTGASIARNVKNYKTVKRASNILRYKESLDEDYYEKWKTKNHQIHKLGAIEDDEIID